MDNSTRTAPPVPLTTGSTASTAGAASIANLAKGALRRLALAKQEPTPDNYARAYAEEAGLPPPAPAAAAPGAASTAASPWGASAQELKAQGMAWSALTERVAKNLERGGRQWTNARRRDSLKRLFDGSRSDAPRLQKRLLSLMAAWESDSAGDPAETGIELPHDNATAAGVSTLVSPDDGQQWQPLVSTLEGTIRAGLPPDDARAAELAAQLGVLARMVAKDGARPEVVEQMDALCQQARRVFGHRHHLVDQLGVLCQELSAGLTDLAEDESWARGQLQSLQARLADGVSARSVRAASTLLAETRERQRAVRTERQQAREALKHLIHEMLVQVGELGDRTGQFQQVTAQHARAIEHAESLEGLAGVVKAMIADTRNVQSAVGETQRRLLADQGNAMALEGKVRELEIELRRLSEEVSTDALTQVANRRGLLQAFEAERARCLRAEGTAAMLAVGLIDIDNFKKLNDTLGHAAGDVALKSLAGTVRDRLRPADHLARFGGEEFVVLLPATDLEEARQILSRLQRSLTESLFLHEGREVFVTFSAGVTQWRHGEDLQASLERADEALYEAKRTGKNRTCTG